MKNWIVVANASRARVLEEAEAPAGAGAAPSRYVHVADLVHPGSRRKGVALDSDRPGRVAGAGHGLGSASYLPHPDPRRREHDIFAGEVARVLDQGVADGRCAGLVLVASRPFLGLLRGHLGEHASKAVLRSLAADYTSLDEVTLATRLARSQPLGRPPEWPALAPGRA